MSRISVIMMSDTGGELDVTGDPVRGDGYYGLQDGLHTVSIQASRLIGRVWIEGTLVAEPKEEDWFSIHLGGEVPYLDFPLQIDSFQRAVAPVNGGDSGTYVFNFKGNFVWLRARLDRSYIHQQPDDFEGVRDLGSVARILLNH